MKTIKVLTATLILTMTFGIISCDDSIEEPAMQENIIPERFSIEVPESLTQENISTSGRYTMTGARTADDDFNGRNIYQLLRLFIRIGEASGNTVEDIITGIRRFNITDVISLSYESDEDGRVKNLVVFENVTYEGKDYEYQLIVTDADSEGNEDGGIGMEVFWNSAPVEGVAILKPFNINRNEEARNSEVLYKIEYMDDSDLGYDSHMIVSITNLPLENPLDDPYSIDKLKMFVGRTGETVDVYGNSNHPNARFFNEEVGFNWAFVASGIKDNQVGVAEVGLPPSSLDDDTREVILGDYAIKQVFTEQILDVYPNLTQELIDRFLKDTEAPGYFGQGGFIQGGDSPGERWDPLVERIQTLVPYNPTDISNLTIEF